MLEFIKNNSTFFLIVGIAIIVFVFYYALSFMKFNKSKNNLIEMQNLLKTGDEVVLSCGIFGKVVELNEASALIEVSPGNTLKISRFAISTRKETEQE